jgi:hypothetical protein
MKRIEIGVHQAGDKYSIASATAKYHVVASHPTNPLICRLRRRYFDIDEMRLGVYSDRAASVNGIVPRQAKSGA